MALQPIDRMKGKQFAKTADRKIRQLVVRTYKTLLPSMMSSHDPRKKYFRGYGWYY